MLQAPNQIKELIETWPPEVVTDILAVVVNGSVVSNLPIKGKEVNGFIELDYEYLFGGIPQLVEKFNDLKEIDVYDLSDTSSDNLSILDKAGEFDIAEYIANKQYLLLCNITNNSGGTPYYIPAKFYPMCLNLAKSHNLSNPK